MRKLHCIYGVCKSDSRQGLSGYDPNVMFFKFPNPCLEFRKTEFSRFRRNPLPLPEPKLVKKFIKHHISSCKTCEICEKWVLKCKREDGKFSTISDIKKDTYICSKHFPPSTTKLDLFVHLPGETKPKRNKRKRPVLVLESGLQECVSTTLGPQNVVSPGSQNEVSPGPQNEVSPTFNDDAIRSSEWDAFSEVSQSQLILEEIIHAHEDHSAPQNNTAHQQTQTSGVHTFSRPTQTTRIKDKKSNKMTQTVPGLSSATQTTLTSSTINDMVQELETLRKQNEALHRENVSLCSRLDHGLFERFETQLKDNERMCQFFCGFNYSQLSGIVKFFRDGKDVHHWGSSENGNLNESRKMLSPLQEFILTLLRLRGGLLIEELHHLLGLSTGLISSTVTKWIQLMYAKLLSLRTDMFPSREKIKETLPKRFRNMRNVRVVIDGAEIFCEAPSDFSQQSNCYSSYKGHSTFKFIIGVTPQGAVSFVSDLFEGSISDRELVIQSGLINLLDEGDEVLADRGFTIKDLTDKKNVKLRIPSFLNGRQCLTPQEEMDTRIIAKNRIFVEHAVRRVKEFRFLQRVVPQTMRHVLSQAVYVCACLTNFQKPLDL